MFCKLTPPQSYRDATEQWAQEYRPKWGRPDKGLLPSVREENEEVEEVRPSPSRSKAPTSTPVPAKVPKVQAKTPPPG